MTNRRLSGNRRVGAVPCLLFLVAILLSVPASAIDIDDIQTQVFNGSCALSGCHAGTTFPNLSSGQSYDNIVNQRARQSPLDLIEPFEPDNSYLVHKIEGTGGGSRMPLGGALAADQIQLIRDWVLEGALEDDSIVGDDEDEELPEEEQEEEEEEQQDSSGLTQARAYYMTSSTGRNTTFLHIINSSTASQHFTGTLYNANGEQLGTADQLLGDSVQSQGRLVLSSSDLEALFNVAPWRGPAMLEVSGTAGFELMSKLTSHSGLVSNSNCTSQGSVHNVEGFDSDNLTYIRLINIGDEPLRNIRGTLWDSGGHSIGTENSQLIDELGPRQAVFLNRNNLRNILGSEWDGVASLTISESLPSLRLINLLFVNEDTFLNFSCFENHESGSVYQITNATRTISTETHFINTGEEALALTGSLYAKDGSLLGPANTPLFDTDISPAARRTLDAVDIERVFGTSTWNGAAMMEVSGTGTFELMSRLTSPGGLVSNPNCARRGNVHNIEGVDSRNTTWVRFINKGSTAITNIRGTLYDQNGNILGNANTTLFGSLAAKAQAFLNRNQFENLFGVSWNGEASMVVTADNDEELRLLNLNIANGETFFNFSCYESSGDSNAPDGETYFSTNISSQVIQSTCINCHVEDGLAAATRLVYTPDSEQGHLADNFDLLNNFVSEDPDNANLILQKARGIDHGGGQQLSSGSDEYRDLTSFLVLMGGQIDPGNITPLGAFWEGVELANPEETLRRASLIVARRLPTDSELSVVRSGGDSVLRSALRNLMEGDGFHDFLITGANDRLHTDAFMNGLFMEVGDLYTSPFFPIGANRFFEADTVNTWPQWVVHWYWGLARSPLELIAYIVENDRSYQEVVTADYMMMNPTVSEILLGNVQFDSGADHRTYQPAQNRGQILITQEVQAEFILDQGLRVDSWGDYIDYPHAGVLNSHAFLNRYPTTETNRNRARARWTFYHFLDLDIEKSAARTTDPEALADTDNPTLNNPACTVCHEIHDPVAGTFQNYGNTGIYRDQPGGMDSLPDTYKHPEWFDEDAEPGEYQQGDTWFRDMRPPGLGSMLANNPANSVQWLGGEIANDNRFATAAVKFWWPAIMGTEAATAPASTDLHDYAAQLAAFEQQSTFLAELGESFTAGINGGQPFNARDMMVEMLMSPWFRAKAIDIEASSTSFAATTPDVGMRRLLTPLELEWKTERLLGWIWGNDPTNPVEWQYDNRYTYLKDQFGIYYGDIDSNGIKARSRALTSLMANVAEKQAVAMACPAVVLDFARPDAERLIFDGIEKSTTPATEFSQAFEVTAGSLEEAAAYLAAGYLNAGEKRVFISFTNASEDGNEEGRNLHAVTIRLLNNDNIALLDASLSDLNDIAGASAGCGEPSTEDYTLWSNCSLSIPFSVDADGTYTIEVTAWGDQAGSDAVGMSVSVIDTNYVDGNSAGALAIREKLIELHQDFLGESLNIGDEELEMSYLLLVETWLERRSSSDNGWAWSYPNENCYFYLEEHWADGGPASQASDQNAMLNTWTSMLIYLMTDFYYLHE